MVYKAFLCLPKNVGRLIVSKQCTCSRRVHVEGHMNRVGLNLILVILEIIPIAIVVFFLSKKEHNAYLLQHNCLMIA